MARHALMIDRSTGLKYVCSIVQQEKVVKCWWNTYYITFIH